MVDIVDVGASAGDGTGDTLRGGGIAINAKFATIDAAIADIVAGVFPDSSVTTAKIADGAVTEVKVASGAVTNAKLANMAHATIKGRTRGSGAGAPTDLTPTQIQSIAFGDAALGEIYIIPASTVVEIDVPGDVATLQEAIDGVALWQALPGGSVQINVTGKLSTTTAGTFTRADGFPIKIKGATAPIDLTFVSFDEATGSAGNRSIGINVSSASGVEVNDVILCDGFAQTFPDSGSKAIASGMASGAFMYGYNILGDANTLVSWSGTTVTFSQAVTSTILPVGTILILNGQIRYVSARPTDTTATVSTALNDALNSYIYWALAKAESGTISATAGSGVSTIAGSGTALTTVASPGSILLVCDADEALVLQSVTNATTAAVERERTFSGKNFAVINCVEEMETALLVTGVAGNKITVRHEGWGKFAPPFRNITPTTLKVIKDSVAATANGLIFNGGGVTIDRIALLGNSSGAGLSATECDGSGVVYMTSTAAVIGFQYGAHFEGGMTLDAPNAYFHGAALAGLYFTHGATMECDSVRSHAAGYYSVLSDLGGNGYLSRARLCCSGEDAIRGEVGGSVYADWSVAISNGGRAYQLIGKYAFHLVGAKVLKNGGIGTGGGLDMQNGAGGRADGMFIGCNYGSGVSDTTGSATVGYATIIGNSNGVYLGQGGILHADRMAIVGNDAYAVEGRGGLMTAPECMIKGNASDIVLFKLTSLDLSGGYCTDAISAYGNSQVYIQGLAGAPSLTPAQNTIGQGGALIFTDSLATYPAQITADYRIGNQSSFITGSASGGLLAAGTVSTVLNGVTSGETSTYFNAIAAAGAYLRFQFDSPAVVQEVTFYQQSATAHGTWKWQGSHDASTWVDIGSSFTFGSSTTQVMSLSANTTRYRYYQIIGVSGTTSGAPYLYEFQFKCA